MVISKTAVNLELCVIGQLGSLGYSVVACYSVVVRTTRGGSAIEFMLQFYYMGDPVSSFSFLVLPTTMRQSGVRATTDQPPGPWVDTV